MNSRYRKQSKVKEVKYDSENKESRIGLNIFTMYLW